MGNNGNELPPHSDEAERGLLASFLVDPTTLSPAKSKGLGPMWFYDERHRVVFAAVEAAATQGAVDLITVSENLRNAGKLEGTGGVQFLNQIQDETPSAANWSFYFDIIREKFRVRRAIDALTRVGIVLNDSLVPVDSKFRDVETALVTIRSLLAPDVGGVVGRLSELPSKQRSDPDELLWFRYLCRGGGLLFVGPTGVGKSAFAMQCAILWALGKPAFGIAPARPLRSLIIQAENDLGDLGEMRDGIIAGLGLTQPEAQSACDQIVIAREDSRTGREFLALTVEPLLNEHKPDLLWIDPALSYLGGEVNSQRDVGAFLRNGLNPLLHRFNCGCIVIHHTNKPPSGREKPDWVGSDFAYLGSGSAEWANWARAVLAMRSMGGPGMFELRAAKRGSRLAWKHEDGNTSYTKYIAHSNEPGVICWHEIDRGEVNTAGGRPKEHDERELLELLREEGLTSTEWKQEAKNELGIGERTFFRVLKMLRTKERILKSKINGKWLPINPRGLPK